MIIPFPEMEKSGIGVRDQVSALNLFYLGYLLVFYMGMLST